MSGSGPTFERSSERFGQRRETGLHYGVSLNPLESRGEADGGVVVADALGVTEVDRPTGVLATVGDLVVAFGDRRSDVPLPQPCSVRL